jgi:Protein of unknown function (DUF429)
MVAESQTRLLGLPSAGRVLGVDVGFSKARRSSAVCLLEWDLTQITWSTQRFRALPAEREAAIKAVAGTQLLQAAAFDGPLRAGFEIIGRYRAADRMLTKRLQPRIGKPGQTSAPVGIELNRAANACVRTVLENCRVAHATHAVRIDERAVVEAFPTTFLGVMLRDPKSLAVQRSNRSDIFFLHLAGIGTLQHLMTDLLPNRSLAASLDDVTNHDDRAALVCALTALSVAAGDFTAVGDTDGWIILPPYRFIRSWARSDLASNVGSETEAGRLFQVGPRLILKGVL